MGSARFWKARPDLDVAIVRLWAAGATRGQIARKLNLTSGKIGGRIHALRKERVILPRRMKYRPNGTRRYTAAAEERQAL